MNASLELARGLHENLENSGFVELPVEYDSAFTRLKEKVLEFQPDVVLSFGESSEAKQLRFEASGLNMQHSEIGDNVKKIYQLLPISEEKGHGEFSTWNLKRVGELFQEDQNIRLSFFAGTYVCNRLFYDLLQNERTLNCKAAFIHTPCFDLQKDLDFNLQMAVNSMRVFCNSIKGDPSCLSSVSI